MKSRICFYFAAVVALVFFVASLSSHATERRDPLIVPDAQTQGAKTSHAAHAKASHKKPSSHQQNASSASASKSGNQGAPASFEAKDQIGPENSSGSGRTSAGK